MKQVILIISLLLFFSGCGGGGGGGGSSSPSDTTLVSETAAALSVDDLLGANLSSDAVTVDLELPTAGENGTLIVWQSSNTAYVSNAGVVTRPDATAGDQNVTLTATITKGEASGQKQFTVRIIAAQMSDAQSVADAETQLTFAVIGGENPSATQIVTDLNLSTEGPYGTTLTWRSGNTAYLNHDGTVTQPTATQGDQAIVLSVIIKKDTVSKIKLFNLTVIALLPTDAEKLALAVSALDESDFLGSNSSPSTITSDLQLPSVGLYDTLITWSSSATSYITDGGTVSRPSYLSGDKSVTLTATLTLGSEIDTKQFSLTVKAADITDTESVSEATDALDASDFLGSNLTVSSVMYDLALPSTGLYGTTVSWSSGNLAYLAHSGAVTRPDAATGSQTVVLTATITKGSVSQTKQFTLVILAEAAVSSASPTLLVIRIEFNDYSFVSPESTWVAKVFGTSQGQLNHYFSENSDGAFTFSKAVESYGTVNDGMITVKLNENHPGNVDEFVTRLVTAVNMADAYIDFSVYDADHNSYIDRDELQIMFLVAGYEYAYKQVGQGIWAHSWCLQGQSGAYAPTVDSVKVMSCTGNGSYARFGELHDDHDATIGIIAHELGHAVFDLPDLYDPDGSSDGIGYFGMMGIGTWGYTAGQYGGSTPTHFSAWSKIEVGWVTPLTLSGSQNNIALNDTNSASYKPLRINTGRSGEYFLIENRSTSGYDAGFYAMDSTTFAGGVAIWHIDDNQATSNNTDNGTDTHRRVDLEEAFNPTLDNAADDDYGNRTNLFYSGNKTDFTPTSSPSSLRYDGTSDGISVTNVSAAGSTMYLDVSLP